MPRLSERTRQLEDELGEKAVEVLAENVSDGVEHIRAHHELMKHLLVSMHTEDLG